MRGYQVVTAASGGEAVIVAPSVRPDLVLVDATMPDMTGRECRSHLEAGGVNRPVLLLCTGACNPVDCRIDSCVEKFDFDGLLGTVDRLLPRAA
jgi:CheY-like chemotaxis protein